MESADPVWNEFYNEARTRKRIRREDEIRRFTNLCHLYFFDGELATIKQARQDAALVVPQRVKKKGEEFGDDCERISKMADAELAKVKETVERILTRQVFDTNAWQEARIEPQLYEHIFCYGHAARLLKTNPTEAIKQIKQAVLLSKNHDIRVKLVTLVIDHEDGDLPISFSSTADAPVNTPVNANPFA